ncbi:SCP2 domain-containing protein [Chitinimonas sp. BJYL2]|uniref:ubiquinone biosynthesis accessory factor UbiJ n=1 Tax=Chitinimonas sp. BJYL2 TaxID=2976696 RepID=UPI0022B32DF9|nr:hypothetical protein [Chitinimonas sp. BJYL2]
MIRLAIFNHLLAQRADLRGELAGQAGKVVLLRIAPLQLGFMIEADGSVISSHLPPDASIDIPPSLLPRLALHDPAAERGMQISGDMLLAASVGRVLQALDWDAEADLARLIGDIPAHRLASMARDLIGDPRQIARNLAETSAEYLQEEARLLATGPAVAKFIADVDRLRDDTARLDKRLQQLEARQR